MLNQQELAAIFDRRAGTVYMVARGYGLQKVDCEDIVQETFMRLMHAAPRFRSLEHEKAWLIVTAGNLCKNHFKRASNRDLPLEDWDEEGEEVGEEARELLWAMRRMPERLRLVLHLTYYEGYKSHEVADILGLHPASVRRKLVEARECLKLILEGGKYDRREVP